MTKRNVEVVSEVLDVERPRLMGANFDNVKVSGGKNGVRVAVWRSVDIDGIVSRELISEDYYKPIHALAYDT